MGGKWEAQVSKNQRILDKRVEEYCKEHRPGVKFCVSVFRQSQEWRWKAGRILA